MRLVAALALLSSCIEYGYAPESEQIEEVFRVEGVRTDILFVADTSYSMQHELITLGTNAQAFVDRLDAGSQDWQLIAVTGPDGCAQGGVLTSDTPDFAQTFATGIVTSPGQDLVDEWGLHNAMRAVLRSVPGGCNEGFVRPQATLHVIFLSDEDDNSPGWEQGGDYWRDYVDPILYTKESEDLVRFSAVGGPVPGGCDGADPAYGYWDAVRATSGEFLSICDAWVDDLELLADTSVSRDRFVLAHEPVVESLEVLHDDVLRESGWAWDPPGNAVVFYEDPPIGGETIAIRYKTFDTD